jgi:hypothetical protein
LKESQKAQDSHISLNTLIIMVAVAPNVLDAVATTVNVNEERNSAKQLQRLEEQKARDAKKAAKRQFKALQKERRAAEKARKEEERSRKMEELKAEKDGKTPKEMEEEKRREEERELFEKEFGITDDQSKVQKMHIKKSAFDSNRLGGTHMA